MSVQRYRYYCTTESAWVYRWDTVEPTTCPNNNGHSINTSSISIVETVSNESVEIKQIDTDSPIFMVDTIDIPVAANETKTHDFSYKFDISTLEVTITGNSDMNGDDFDVIIAPNTTIGALGANVAVDDETFTVSSTVLDNILVGMGVTLFDGTNSEDVGYCYAIDRNASTISCVTPSTTAFTAATPTYVQISAYKTKGFVLRNAETGPITIGSSTIGSSYIPKNTTIRIIYRNKTAQAKTFTPIMEYFARE